MSEAVSGVTTIARRNDDYNLGYILTQSKPKPYYSFKMDTPTPAVLRNT